MLPQDHFNIESCPLFFSISLKLKTLFRLWSCLSGILEIHFNYFLVSKVLDLRNSVFTTQTSKHCGYNLYKVCNQTKNLLCPPVTIHDCNCSLEISDIISANTTNDEIGETQIIPTYRELGQDTWP